MRGAWFVDMARFGKKDPKLSEVKAVLERLQGLPTETEPGRARSSVGESRSVVRKAGMATAVLILVSAAGIFGTAYLFVGIKGIEKAPPPPDAASAAAPVTAASTPPPRRIDPAKAPDAKTTLEGARALLSKGRVRSAREQLLTFAKEGSADAAWDLARSYDPNFLSALPAADGTADIKEAERWYRTWYSAAVQEGLVADSVSLERIIRSMKP
jgi:hypothetical protein